MNNEKKLSTKELLREVWEKMFEEAKQSRMALVKTIW